MLELTVREAQWNRENTEKLFVKEHGPREKKPIIHHLIKWKLRSDTTTDSEWLPITCCNTEGFSLPNKLSDSWKRSVNARPTLWWGQSLLNGSLFERCEGEGAVSAGANYFRADGFLAHQGGGGGGEDFILAAVLVVRRLMTLILLIGGKINCLSVYTPISSVCQPHNDLEDASG